jgi:hypothetical protein
MSKQRVIILLVCCSVIIAGTLCLRPIYLREKTDTERKIKNNHLKYAYISPVTNAYCVMQRAICAYWS